MVDFNNNLKKYSPEEFQSALDKGEVIDGLSQRGSARIKITRLIPWIILCQHSGTYIEESIAEKMAITKQQRHYEEDLYVDELFDCQPVTIFATYSRYMFDTNRPAEKAIYLNKEDSWDIQVFKTLLTQIERNSILKLYKEFYDYIDLIITSIIEHYGGCIIYDFHSFNASYPERQNRDLPAFNLGTMTLNHLKYRYIIDNWLKEHNKINIKNISGKVRENDVFGGRGGMARYISATYNDAVIFPTEIRKFFMNENSYLLYPEIWNPLKKQLNQAINRNSDYFVSKLQYNKRNKLSDFMK